MALCVQLRHSLSLGPLQVPQASSHAKQYVSLAYLPIGVQEARQRPGGSRKGVADAHVEQSVADGPTHVAQLAWHGVHVSAAEELPPAQV